MQSATKQRQMKDKEPIASATSKHYNSGLPIWLKCDTINEFDGNIEQNKQS